MKLLSGMFLASRNSPLLQNIFPGAGGKNQVNLKYFTSLLAFPWEQTIFRSCLQISCSEY
jgi:hypothetical protein